MEHITVGRAAATTGLSRKAVRLYESKGLLPETERTRSGYRLYTTADLDVLHFIRRARSLGLNLDEIKDVLELQRGGAQPCDRVTSLLDAHLAEIDRKLADLRRLHASLQTARHAADTARCDGRTATVCTIIDDTSRIGGDGRP